jgi:hypothetical protein
MCMHARISTGHKRTHTRTHARCHCAASASTPTLQADISQSSRLRSKNETRPHATTTRRTTLLLWLLAHTSLRHRQRRLVCALARTLDHTRRAVERVIDHTLACTADVHAHLSLLLALPRLRDVDRLRVGEMSHKCTRTQSPTCATLRLQRISECSTRARHCVHTCFPLLARWSLRLDERRRLELDDLRTRINTVCYHEARARTGSTRRPLAVVSTGLPSVAAGDVAVTSASTAAAALPRASTDSASVAGRARLCAVGSRRRALREQHARMLTQAKRAPHSHRLSVITATRSVAARGVLRDDLPRDVLSARTRLRRRRR